MRSLALFFLLCISVSCKKKDFLAGFDKRALFAAPSAVETDAVLNEWQSRNLTPTGYAVVQETPLSDGKYTFKIVSFTVAGIKEYGALIIPKTNTPVPVRVMISGFSIDHAVTSRIIAIGDNSDQPFILAIPALRGQKLALTVNGTAYSSPLSEGKHCDAFDGATDDVIAFLNLIQATENKADINRTSVRGGSRGGTVALLAGIRDKRVKAVVNVVGPTDLMALTAVSENDATYQCQFLDALVHQQASMASTRLKMIASSPLYFADKLPATQIHMGIKDKNVPIAQGHALQEEINQSGSGAAFTFFSYDRGHADMADNNPELENRIKQFLDQF
ncbi:prolyl oligopeptidase family serine peptidase [Chitinophaga niabensis]|uniref:alpha/beta hydrolase family protein n=1 Tax=Chitinophaga niabensis TaxID=536979 RepID=UPI0031BA04D8